jgi:hypothetical protein
LTAVKGSPTFAYFRAAGPVCRPPRQSAGGTPKERAPAAEPLARGHVCLRLPTSRSGRIHPSTDVGRGRRGMTSTHQCGCVKARNDHRATLPAAWCRPARVFRIYREGSILRGIAVRTLPSAGHFVCAGGPTPRVDHGRARDSRIHGSPKLAGGEGLQGIQSTPPVPTGAGRTSQQPAAVQEGDKR